MAEEQKKEDAKLTMADIRKMVTDTVSEVVKGITPSEAPKDKEESPTRTDRPVGIAAAVQAEVDKIRAKEASEARDATIDKKLAELAEATAEKPPVERRRVHKLMGWGE